MKKIFVVLSVIFLFAAVCSDNTEAKKAKEEAKKPAVAGQRISGAAAPAPRMSPAPRVSGAAQSRHLSGK